MPVNDMHVPHFIERGTGVLLMDSFPLVSLVAAIPTIIVANKQGRQVDVVIYSFSFVLAAIFHGLQLSPVGLSEATFLGIPGSTWRTWDVIVANVVLVRTIANGLDVTHPAVKVDTCGCIMIGTIIIGSHSPSAHYALHAVIPNILLPGGLLGNLALYPKLDIIAITKITLSCFILMLGGKLLIDSQAVPKYSSTGSRTILLSMILGLTCFGMPHAQPSFYWFWHSLWHCFMSVSFHAIYAELGAAMAVVT